MEPRCISLIMLLPRTGASLPHPRYCMAAPVSIRAAGFDFEGVWGGHSCPPLLTLFLTALLMTASAQLPRACQNQRDVIRLFVVADPVVYRRGHGLADLIQWKMPVFADQINQPLFAEFAKIVFRFGDAVAVGEKDFARLHLDASFFIDHVVEQADHRASGLEAPDATVLSDQDGRQVPAVAVGEPVRAAVVDAEKQRGIFFRRSAFEELVVEQGQQSSGRNFYALRPGRHDPARAGDGAH